MNLVDFYQELNQNQWGIWGIYACIILVLIFIIFPRIFVAIKRRQRFNKNLTQNLKYSQQKNHQTAVIKTTKLGIDTSLFIKNIYENIALIGLDKDWNQLLILFLISQIIIFLGLNKLLDSGFLSLVLTGASTVMIIVMIKVSADKIRNQLVEQIPMFLDALSKALEAGYSLQNAFVFIEAEIPNPLQKRVQEISRKLTLQVPLSEALLLFAADIKQKDISFFAESTIIQAKIGGNLIKLFKKIGSIIEERLYLKRDLKSFTSQGRISGIMIAALFPISLLLFSWLSPAHVEVLFTTEAGKFLLGIAILLEFFGFLMIWKIVNIKL